MKMQYTLNELERAAYISGNISLAGTYARMEDDNEQIELLEETITEQIAENQEDSLSAWERKNGSAQAYLDFFHGCFQHLAKDYPCPSVNSDYDKSIIFDAIRKGEGVTE